MMTSIRVSRSAAALCALMLAGALTACGETVSGTARYADANASPTAAPPANAPQPKLVKLADLPTLMVPPEEVGRVIGVPGVVAAAEYRSLEQVPDDNVSDPKCFGVIFGAVEPVYRGSGYEGVYGQRMANLATMIAGRADQGVVAFGSPQDAQTNVTEQTGAWRDCGGKALTLKVADQQVNWMINAPLVSDGVDVVTRVQEGGDGFGCGRGLQARSNVVIDVVVCGPDGVAAGEQAATLVNDVAAKVPE